MAKPVKNWYAQSNDTPIFGDIVDDQLRHYGPRAIWRPLTRKDLAGKKALFNGVVDLGYDSEEIKALSVSLAGKNVIPLSISGVSEEPTLGIAISPPHIGGLMALNSLPFSQYRLAVTIDLQASDANSIIHALQEGWSAKTLLQGRFTGTVDGVIAKAGFKVKIDTKSCISEILTAEGRLEFSIPDAWRSVQAAVEKNYLSWMAYYGGAEEPEDASVARTALVGILFERCFDERMLIKYDNGMKAVGVQLRDGSTIGEPESRIFVVSIPAKVAIDIEF